MRRFKISNNKYTQTTECINVTKLEANKRRSIFIDSMNRNGFTGFIKRTQNNQTYYIFTYKAL